VITSGPLAVTFLLAACLSVSVIAEQFSGAFQSSRDHPAIQYSTRQTTDAVAELNRKLQAGSSRLSFEGPRGYLKSVLDALEVPVSSQTLVFSETSLQHALINPTNPRALYFNDSLAVGWVRGAPTLEIAAQDPEQGIVFYTIDQTPSEKPQFTRHPERCLECHQTAFTDGVPGTLIMSMLPLSDDPNEYARGWAVDHRTPLDDRWGGWYVTGTKAPRAHLGNVPVHHVPKSYVREAVAPVLASVAEKFDASAFLLPHSDVAALLVLNHQAHMMNLLTRLGWEARIAAGERTPGSARVSNTAREFVDYLLFTDEAPLPGAIRGGAGFAEQFSAAGPRDKKGRSLRQLDLDRRLFRYPCSYMIYAPAFDALPAAAKEAVYARMWTILSGQEKNQVSQLSLADRQAIVEILRDTKTSLPDYFRPIAR
jgi:hypothetical protein